MTEVFDEIGRQAEEYLAQRPESTITLGLSVNGEREVRSYRSPTAEHVVVPDGKSMYEIGSTSKLFEATLLGLLIGDGLIALDDPIGKHLPQQLNLRPEIASLTIRQLATHSSGFGSVGKIHQKFIAEETRGTDTPFGCYTHYLRYKKEHLYSDLETAELEYPTGEGWLYSVLGMGTLGHIIELVADQPYEELLIERVCNPLGLADIRYTLSDDQLGRMVYAYDLLKQPQPNWYHDVMLPQGGLRGTVDDLLTFAEANLKTDDSPVSQAMERTRQVYFEPPADYIPPGETEPPDFVQGLAWRGFARPNGHAWWHGGTTLFYLAGCGADEHAQVGIALLQSGRTSLLDRAVLHPLQVEWFRLACEAA